MRTFIREEFSALRSFFPENRTETVVIGTALLGLCLERYVTVWNEWFGSCLFFAGLPLLAILLLKRNPLDYGLRAGEPKRWLPHVIVFCLVTYPILWAASSGESFHAYYRTDDFSFIPYFLATFADLFATEFIFRGFLLFGLAKRFGRASILIQTIPFVLVHLGKPELETYSTILTGVWFGWMCWRGKSMWPAFIVHMFINIYFVTVVNG